MKFTIDQNILSKYPSLTIGVIVCKGINNKGKSEEVLEIINQEVEKIKNNYEKATLKEQPTFHAWREAYRAFGAKPKKYTCSVENLYRMCLEGVELGHINKIVDVYNYISLKHMLPVGGDDIDHIDGGIKLCLASGDEQFIRLNSQNIDHPKPGEVVYMDDKEVLCRRWNRRECDKSKMISDTINATLVVERIQSVEEDEVQKILAELAGLVQKYCGGENSTYVLDIQNSTIDFDI